jgi:DNA-binding transcriptional MerR regulator
MADDGRMTIEELARRAGTATTTVRMYQTKGLLPPPERRGRIGYYGKAHLARLRLIAGLQDQGFSLAGIRRLTEAWENGRSLEDILGLETRVASAWAGEEPVKVGLRELRELFPGQKITPAVVSRSARMGLISIEGTSVLVRNPGFLRVGAELARHGIGAMEILDELEALQASAGEIAERFTRVFERHMWKDFTEAGMPSEAIAPLTESLGQLSALAEEIMQLVLRDALRKKGSAFLAEQAIRLDEASLQPPAQRPR